MAAGSLIFWQRQSGSGLLFNILDEPVIRFDTVGGSRVAASLPEVYEALMADRVQAFPALRPHQRHGWHAFLVQLGVVALVRSASGQPPEKAGEWATALRGLTDQFPDDEPWCLVVGDITRPAFLQPPATSVQRAADYKRAVATPDELDMLRTARNHDLKAAVAIDAQADDWLFALVTVQTMDGFEGPGNYGISRMNRGTSSRPAFSLVPPGGLGAHTRRDIVVLVDRWGDLSDAFPRRDPGHALLWTVPWDGTKEQVLAFDTLDPLYIEICRRVRLRSDPDGGLHAKRATSKGPRIEAKQLKGRTGDPWTPINNKEGKSLTLAAGGFTYKRMTEYLTSPDFKWPVLLEPTHAEQRSQQGMRLVARAMVRGQGKTEGYWERSVPFRSRAVRAFGTEAGVRTIGGIAQERITEVGIVQRILSHAIQTFAAQGQPDGIRKEYRGWARPWLDRLDAAVDADFFDVLQTEFEADTDQERSALRRGWLLGVVETARGLLGDASDALPCRAVYRYRARSSAESLFEGRLRGPAGLPFVFTEGR